MYEKIYGKIRFYSECTKLKEKNQHESQDLIQWEEGMVGDAGFEPTTFGSGDQRSIQLS